MLRWVALVVGLVGDCFGVALLLWLRFAPPSTHALWLLAVILVSVSWWLLRRAWSDRVALAILLLAASVVYFASLQFWPRPVGSGFLSASRSVTGEGAGSSAAGGVPLDEIPLVVPEPYRRGVFATPRTLIAPAGFNVSVFAAGLGSPRFLAVAPDGSLYVSVPQQGRVLALIDSDHDGVAERTVVFAEGLDRPHGLAFSGNNLYIAESGRLRLARDLDGDHRADSLPVISDDLPAGGGHWTRSVTVGPDDHLYVSVGSNCNACIDADWRRAAVLRLPLAGGAVHLFARGLRNSVGLAFHPQTGELWGSDNGRDLLGDDLPPEEINRIVAGGDYGWPFCYGERSPDPDFGTSERCRQTIPPEVEMQAHSAPLGIAFGEGLAFPEAYRRMLLVAFHGSWNRTVPTGYKLVGIPFHAGRPAGAAVDLFAGWLRDGVAWGRPVAPAVGADGALYLSDDRAGAIYRITYTPAALR